MNSVFMCVCAALLLIHPYEAHAQSYPGKPVRLLVGYTPGGSNDIVARVVAAKMSEVWGQQMLVENRPGAGSNIAAEIAAKAVPDGYTLLLCVIATHGINPSLHKKLNFDPIRDFAPITRIAVQPNTLVVHLSFPARSVGDLIAYAKANPGKLSYASGGVGTSLHLSGELLRSMTGINIVHVPYKGTGPASADLLAGYVPVMFGGVASVLSNIKAGRIRALGVTSAKRSQHLPNVPTIAESGVAGYEVTAWFGMCAPAAVPKPILEKLNTDTVRALNAPDLQQRLAEQGMDAAPTTPEEFSAFIRSEMTKWAKVVKSSGITAE